VGPDHRHARGRSLTRIVRVVPNVPTFAVDGGFRYAVPDDLDGITLGSLVRIPLGGRRTRGFVTEVLPEGDGAGLRPVLGRVGDLPVLAGRLIETMRWASVHYVAPFAVLLAKAAPPNAPRRIAVEGRPVRSVASPLADLAGRIATGSRVRPHYLVGGGPWTETIAGLAAPVLEAGRPVAVIAPTVHEAHALAAGLGDALGIFPWPATSTDPARQTTRAWAAPLSAPGQLVVGTREIALWPLGGPALVVVVEEGRAAMKSPQTPTVGVRDLVRRRAVAERLAAVFAGPVPTVETLGFGAEIHQPATRVWPLVEVIDRTEEAPGGGVLMEATVHALAAVTGGGGRAFVFVTRRGEAAAFRCVRCGTIRTCGTCGAAATAGETCRRCGATLGGCAGCGGGRFQALGAAAGRVVAEVRRRVRTEVTLLGEPSPATAEASVLVGTEADLPAVDRVDLAVVVDADALVLAPHYRAEEDALRVLARVAGTVGRGRGRRCLIQTAQASHRVFEALRRGRPLPLLSDLLEERRRVGYPPIGELMAIEITGDADGVDHTLRSTATGRETVLGPAPLGARVRWLVSGADLRPFKVTLRPLVQSWRDRGTRVRIDADPVRL